MQAQAVPAEREVDAVPVVGAVLALGVGERHIQHRGVQRGVEQGRVDAEAAGAGPLVLGQRDLGEEVVAAPPEGRVRPGRPARSRSRPRPAVRSRRRRPPCRAPVGGHTARSATGWAASAGAGAVRVPVACRVQASTPTSPAASSGAEYTATVRGARLRRAADGDLEAHPALLRQHQRGLDDQLFEDSAAHLVTGSHGQLHQTGARDEHRPADRVVGQPGGGCAGRVGRCTTPRRSPALRPPRRGGVVGAHLSRAVASAAGAGFSQ